MKAMTKLIPIICLSIIIGSSLFYSCSQKKKEETVIVLPLETALSQARENRVELEKVLHRYQSNPSDSLKYRAARFLIENMPSYTYYKGKLLEQYLTFFTLLQEARSKKIYPQAMIDSIRRMYGPFSLDSLQYYEDITTVDSAYFVVISIGHLKFGRNSLGGKMYLLPIFASIFFLIVLVMKH